ncbi:MAG: Vms1/Ankzf1 family peptidyl-tRNA hydrolase [Ardenticatenia bacterium]|nr:Vms1/Ankzf1 family peptidyl-tRNA hydrolase [Ardenticatenia bacterium]
MNPLCKQVRAWLVMEPSELTDAQQQQITAHLTTCAACRRYLNELRQIPAALAAAGRKRHNQEARQRLLERLEAVEGVRHYDLLSPEVIRWLASLRSPDAPVVSLYLDISPRRVNEAPVHVRVRRLIDEARQQMGNEVDARLLEQALASVEHFFQGGGDEGARMGQGLALFSAPAIDLWRLYRLPVPVRDRLVIGDRPEVRPLVRLAEEFEPMGIIFVDRVHGRLFRFFMGEIEEWAEQRSTDVPGWHKQGGWSQARYQRHIEAHIEQHFKRVAEDARAFFSENPITRLVLAGHPENTKWFERFLPPELHQKVVAHEPLEHTASLHDVLELAKNVEQEVERQVEAERLESLFNALPQGKGVTGLGNTLRALAEQRVRLLLVAEGVQAPGAECPNCGWLTDEASAEACALCGATMVRADDVVELAIERAVQQADDIDVIRGEGRDRLVREARGIGALLRY